MRRPGAPGLAFRARRGPERVLLGGVVGHIPGYLTARLVAGRETEYRARDRVYGNPIADRRQ